ncbi:D-alanyl-D-alanine carboxypeptidase [Rubidibacter lacunae KORDI 51-2]|uniref:D-alanyl-D-alanine carboxypeptidase n=1 Tax=Rubidibacter lacunae KORDI 51-2 TaxID=582515 RepID=U5DM49_9CHRO|nr:M15 family metallopeptidase [Rubidibacter lacunae]ERN41654.1 D-alanyl-D-alanine carboxypeptidase [Rubidibacter lacunae KORDI 51-2]
MPKPTFRTYGDDIPEARRDRPQPKRSSTGSNLALVIGAGAAVVAATVATWLLTRMVPAPDASVLEPNVPTAAPEPTDKPALSSEEARAPDDGVLGHLPYDEAQASDLVALTADGRIRLHAIAAADFIEMQAAARADGILLEPLSGFRTLSEQDYLFFGIAAQRSQNPSDRANVSAPPGYSEHHTGYAVDIGDGRVPATHVEETFEDTAAFDWLQANASRFHFELSFPRNNSQGISYEPWHWRYVGDRDSLEAFYKARQLDRQ